MRMIGVSKRKGSQWGLINYYQLISLCWLLLFSRVRHLLLNENSSIILFLLWSISLFSWNSSIRVDLITLSILWTEFLVCHNDPIFQHFLISHFQSVITFIDIEYPWWLGTVISGIAFSTLSCFFVPRNAFSIAPATMDIRSTKTTAELLMTDLVEWFQEKQTSVDLVDRILWFY